VAAEAEAEAEAVAAVAAVVVLVVAGGAWTLASSCTSVALVQPKK
jgi:hypothetical protein